MKLFPLLTGRIILSNKKINLKKYSVVFFKHFPKKGIWRNLHKSVLKPIWLYGIHIRGTASSSNVEKLQRRQSKHLRIITKAPWYIRNSNIHIVLKDLPLVREEIKIASVNCVSRIIEHPNRLVTDLRVFEGVHRRLKRLQTNDLIKRSDLMICFWWALLIVHYSDNNIFYFCIILD